LTPGVVICDLDGTLISVSSELEFVLGLFRRKVLSRAVVIRFLYHYLRHPIRTMQEGRGWNRGYFAGLPVDVLHDEVEDCTPHLLKKVRPEVLRVLNEHKQAGAEVFILSASLSPLVQAVAEGLGFKSFRGSIPVVKNGKCTGHLIGQRPYGKAKIAPAMAMMDQLGLEPSQALALGDSWGDRFILGLCGFAIAVHPVRKLRKLAVQNNWTILDGR
jgi:HAD superfamily hydrolase (TIGR01490 family)